MTLTLNISFYTYCTALWAVDFKGIICYCFNIFIFVYLCLLNSCDFMHQSHILSDILLLGITGSFIIIPHI